MRRQTDPIYRTWLEAFPLFLIYFLILGISIASASTAEVGEVYFDPVDETRDRVVPLKVYFPDEQTGPLPLVLFSHGLGGSSYLGHHWSAAGFICVFVQHPGSDQSVWQDLPREKRMEALKAAASAESYKNRVVDIPFVLDFLESTNIDPASPLKGRLDMDHIAMTGHSFGAATTQGMMGQKHFRIMSPDLSDDRLDCFIPMSPSASKRISDKKAFGHISKPVLCMTGTLDTSAISPDVTAESRLRVFEHLPAGDKYQVNFFEGAHMIFSESQRPRQYRDPRFHPAIQEITTHFLNAYLKQDEVSLAWLQSDAPHAILVKQDTWEWK